MSDWVHPINKAAERIAELEQRTHELEQENAWSRRHVEVALKDLNEGRTTYARQSLKIALAGRGALLWPNKQSDGLALDALLGEAQRALIAVEDLAIALCEATNETEQNYYRKQLGVLLCGWPE